MQRCAIGHPRDNRGGSPSYRGLPALDARGAESGVIPLRVTPTRPRDRAVFIALFVVTVHLSRSLQSRTCPRLSAGGVGSGAVYLIPLCGAELSHGITHIEGCRRFAGKTITRMGFSWLVAVKALRWCLVCSWNPAPR